MAEEKQNAGRILGIEQNTKSFLRNRSQFPAQHNETAFPPPPPSKVLTVHPRRWTTPVLASRAPDRDRNEQF